MQPFLRCATYNTQIEAHASHRAPAVGSLSEDLSRSANGLPKHELTVTPHGHLVVRETPADAPAPAVSKALLQAYAHSPARGMLYSAAEDVTATLPASFEFARSIARLYLTNLCRAAIAEPEGVVPELSPPADELAHAVLQAPPMPGQ